MLIPKELAAIAKIAAKESTRYAINGVYVKRTQSGACVASVTDGRRMVQVTWNDSHDLDAKPVKGFSAIVPAPVWKEALKSVPRRENEASLAESGTKPAGNMVAMESTDGETSRLISVPQPDGGFPRVADVIPSYEDGESSEIGVDLGLLAEMLTVVQSTVGSEYRNTSLIVPTDPKRPLTIKASNGEGLSVVAVLMPREFKPAP